MRIRFLLKILRGLKVKIFEKGEVLVRRGSRDGDIFFIRKGLVRSYFFNENGDEITFQIYAEWTFFGNVHAMMLSQPSKFTYEALEDTKIYTVAFDTFRKLMRENAEKLELDRSFIFQSTFS